MKKKRLVAGTVLAATVVGCAFGLHTWIVRSVPCSYRQYPLDVIDYIVGKNVFHRSDSLM